jgi:phage/plasmid-like protein (TIGR03299 family)
MSHEIESIVYVGQVPWHGLGKKLDKPPTTREAIVAAGLDWQVDLKPLFVQPTDDGFEKLNWNATVRSSDGSILGVVGPTYKPLQNIDAFSFFDPFVESGVATLETAGSLKQGKRVWVLAKVAGDPVEVVPGDAVERFILLSNGHDGTLAVRVGFSGVRVVCSNTLAMAHGDKASKLLRVRHTSNTVNTLEVIQNTMKVLDQEFLATTEQFKLLAKRQVKASDLKEYIRLVFKPQVVQTVESMGIEAEDADGRADRLYNKILPLFEKGRGNDLPGVAGTLWGAYNSISEMLTWERGRNVDNRLDSLWYGDSAKVNQRALQVAAKMAMVA